MQWWKRNRATVPDRAMSRWSVTRSLPAAGTGDSAPGSALRSRLEVCPPSLADDDADSRLSRISSLLPPLNTVVRWLQTGWYSTDPGASRRDVATTPLPDAGDERLRQARAAFVRAMVDLHPTSAADLRRRVNAAHTLRELWHLRNALFTRVSIDHCESLAMARLAELNQFFAVRDHVPRTRRRFGTRTDGFDPHQPLP